MRISTIDNFWSKVDKKSANGCWLWLGCVSKRGYGKIRIMGKDLRAHRLSWSIHSGEIPEGMLVCHKCDNPSCVNPNHLFLGTHKDNSKDMVLKNRQHRPKGELHGNRKLNEAQVTALKFDRFNVKLTQKELMAKYNISRAHVYNIINGSRWGFVGTI